MNRVRILGVPIDSLTQDDAVARISSMLEDGSKHHVMTPNNEMLVTAHRNSTFKSLLQSSELNIADSTGLLWAARRKGKVLPERVTGVDTVERILLSLPSSHPVFLLGGRNGVGHRVKEIFTKRNSRLVCETFEGTPSEDNAAEIITRINNSGAHLLLVAYGAPAQDMWINEHIMQLTSIRIAMGVGGTFDFLSGAVRRAPLWMQRSGLEWFWRLLQSPMRIRRIWRAVVIFPYVVLRYDR